MRGASQGEGSANVPHLVAKRLHGQGLGVKLWGFRVGGLGLVLSENALFSGST